MMSEIQLRFVKRHVPAILEGVSVMKEQKILQYRKHYKHEDIGYWTDWVDVPLESE